MASYKQITADLKAAVKEYFSTIHPIQKEKYTLFVIELKTELRLYYLNREVVKEHIWPSLRANEDVLHTHMTLVVMCMSKFLATYSEYGYSEHKSFHSDLCEVLASSLGFDINSASLQDVEFTSKLPAIKEVKELLNKESWFLVLVVLLLNMDILIGKETNLLETVANE